MYKLVSISLSHLLSVLTYLANLHNIRMKQIAHWADELSRLVVLGNCSNLWISVLLSLWKQ